MWKRRELIRLCIYAAFGLAASLLAVGLSVRGQNMAPGAPASAGRQDSWVVIGPGGGGSQYCPTISPHDPQRVLVSCDMTGGYISQDGGDSWRMFNLRGTVRFFLFDPLEPDTIYAATIGLWRSTDGGRTWRLVFPHPRFVAGVEMPDDHASETIITSRNTRRLLTALAIDPADSNVLYAAITYEGANFLCTSTDKGLTWEKQIAIPEAGESIYVDPISPAADRTLYLIGNRSVTVRENGRWAPGIMPPGISSFTDLSAGFPTGGGKLVLYAVGTDVRTGEPGIFLSSDGASSWRKSVPISAYAGTTAPALSAVATSLNHPEVAYVSYSNLRLPSSPGSARSGVARTADGGRSWRLVWNEARTSAANVHDTWISREFGPDWGENPQRLGVSPVNPDICFGTDYGRTMRTTDGGETWNSVYSREISSGAYTTTGLDVTTCYGVHFDPFDPRRIFISYTDIGLFRSEDGGTSWISSIAGVPQAWVNTTYWITFDPDVRGRAWSVMSGTHDLPRPKMWRRTNPDQFQGGVCTSEDGGRTWRNVSVNLPPTAATHILLDPGSPAEARTLYVAGFGRGVFKSTDGGRTWSARNSGIDGTQPFAWRLARDRDGILYLVVARRSEDGSFGNEMDGALYRSPDGAGHWDRLPLPYGLNGPNGIAIDPEDPKRLYLAAWGRRGPGVPEQGGIFLSTDGGANWRRTLSKDQHVYDVTIDPGNPTILYACGFESSAWRSADSGETWVRIRGYNFKWGHRVIPDPADPAKIFITTFGGSVWHGPATGDPDAPEDIITPGFIR